MTILWSNPAKDSFHQHIEYLLVRTPQGARAVNTAVIAAIEQLERSPYMGRPGRWENTRELIIQKYPYLVVYRVKNSLVEILYIHHTRQFWPDSSA